MWIRPIKINHLSLLIAFMLLALGADISHGLLPVGCWRQSPDPTSAGECLGAQTCVEWLIEDQNEVILADCCELSAVTCQVGCPSTQSGGDRPLLVVNQDDMMPDGIQDKVVGIEHSVPNVPLFIDGITYLPEEIDRFDGTPLHFLMCRSAIEKSVLYAFPFRQDLIAQAKRCTLGKSTFNVAGIPKKALDGIVFYDSEKWTGPSYFLAGGSQIDLSDSWWEDRISSLRGVGDGTLVTFFENSDRSGSSLTLSTDFGWPNLDALGWDNRASAIMVWPTKKPSPLTANFR